MNNRKYWVITKRRGSEVVCYSETHTDEAIAKRLKAKQINEAFAKGKVMTDDNCADYIFPIRCMDETDGNITLAEIIYKAEYNIDGYYLRGRVIKSLELEEDI